MNQLFFESCTLKFLDIPDLKTMEIMFRVKTKTFQILHFFLRLREGNYNFRQMYIFETDKGRTNVKYRCALLLGSKIMDSLAHC